MDPSNPWSSWTYAYMTPGLVSSMDGTRKEMGTIIISPHSWYALISINDIVANGGLGTPLPTITSPLGQLEIGSSCLLLVPIRMAIPFSPHSA